MVKPRNLQDLELFVLTAELGSLSRAARQLDITPAVASAGLKRLEGELGAVLLLRSTRSLRLTPDGERFLPAARMAINSLHDGVETLSTGRQVIRDHLQLSAPSDLGRRHILPWLDAFMERYPEVSLRLQLSDRPADIFRQPVDLAIRVGPLADSGLVALPLLPQNRRILCAAPAYLARHDRPASPADLTRHNCLRFRVGDEVHEQWQFFRAEETLRVTVSGNRLTDDGDAVHRWALAGLGIAYKSLLDVADDLAAGRLVELCPAWTGESAPITLVCADRRQLSPTVVLLRDFLRQQCQALYPLPGPPGAAFSPPGAAPGWRENR